MSNKPVHEQCIDEIKAEGLDFDRWVWATGNRNKQGWMEIDLACSESEFGKAFLSAYQNFAEHDVVGQLFAALPKVVQVLSTKDYRNAGSNKCCKEICLELEEWGIEHVLLAGVRNSMGYAWATLYRFDENRPFTKGDAEIAAVHIPFQLYKWQKSLGLARDLSSEIPAKTPLLALSPDEMKVLLAYLQKLRAKGAADVTGNSESMTQKKMHEVKAKLSRQRVDGYLSSILGEF